MARLLVVSIDLPLLRTVFRVTEAAGHHVELALSGKRGLRLALAGNYDLVLIDARLPFLDGVTLAFVLREKQLYLDAPLLGIAMDDTERAYMVRAGTDRVLRHPIVPCELASAIADLLTSETEQQATSATAGNHPPRIPVDMRVTFLDL